MYINTSNTNIQSVYLWEGRLWAILIFYYFSDHLNYLPNYSIVNMYYIG